MTERLNESQASLQSLNQVPISVCQDYQLNAVIAMQLVESLRFDLEVKSTGLEDSDRRMDNLQKILKKSIQTDPSADTLFH